MTESTENRIPIDLIARVLSGEADKAEKVRLDKWISLSEENSKILQQYKSLWKRSGEISPQDEININKEWASFVSARNNNSVTIKGTRSLSLFTKLAAAIFAGAVISFSALIGINSIKYEKVSAVAEVTDIQLPDGSTAILYPGSGIKFPKTFKNNRRDVKLDGEAFFNVVKDSLNIFSVSAGDMIVKVLGTSFNIEAYSDSDRYNVIVEEGKVAVFNQKNEQNLTKLLAGDMASFITSGDKILKSVNKDVNYKAWRTGKILFDDADLDEIAITLSKVFMIDIEVRSPLEDQRLTVTFDNRNLEYILETIKATLDITIEENKEKIIIY